jgi:hypothetical protein
MSLCDMQLRVAVVVLFRKVQRPTSAAFLLPQFGQAAEHGVRMLRAAHIIPMILATLYAMAYSVDRGLYVGDMERIDRGTLIRKDCLYLTWNGAQKITAEDKQCHWFFKEFSWR